CISLRSARSSAKRSAISTPVRSALCSASLCQNCRTQAHPNKRSFRSEALSSRKYSNMCGSEHSSQSFSVHRDNVSESVIGFSCGMLVVNRTPQEPAGDWLRSHRQRHREHCDESQDDGRHHAKGRRDPDNRATTTADPDTHTQRHNTHEQRCIDCH